MEIPFLQNLSLQCGGRLLLPSWLVKVVLLFGNAPNGSAFPCPSLEKTLTFQKIQFRYPSSCSSFSMAKLTGLRGISSKISVQIEDFPQTELRCCRRTRSRKSPFAKGQIHWTKLNSHCLRALHLRQMNKRETDFLIMSNSPSVSTDYCKIIVLK